MPTTDPATPSPSPAALVVTHANPFDAAAAPSAPSASAAVPTISRIRHPFQAGVSSASSSPSVQPSGAAERSTGAGTTTSSASTQGADAKTSSTGPSELQKLQQLPAARQQQLVQQNRLLETQRISLLKDYPFLPTQAVARTQQWVDQTYGPGHDVSKLYLVRYGKDPHGHPSHTNTNPALEQEGKPAIVKPLWKVLQDNLPSGSVFGNDYSANRHLYKIVDAGDRDKPYDEAKSVLDPEKLYAAASRHPVNFQVEHGNAIDQYYATHQADIASSAKQRALLQLDVQYETGKLPKDDYQNLKTVLEKGEGGKIYTLSLGDNTIGGSGRFAFDYTLAGGLRIALDSGRHFTYLPKEGEPYQGFDNEPDAIASIRAHGSTAQEAEDFNAKYRSLLGDPSLKNPLAVKDLQDATVSAVFKRSHGDFDQLLRGKPRDITHDPFGELTKASHANDSQDAWDGITSDTDLRREATRKWGSAGLVVLAGLPFVAECLGAGLSGLHTLGGELAGEVGEAAAGEMEAAGSAAEAGSVGAEGAAAGAASGTSKGMAHVTGEGNLGVLDELERIPPPASAGVSATNAATIKLPPPAKIDPARLCPLDNGSYPGGDGYRYVHAGDKVGINDPYYLFRANNGHPAHGWLVDPDQPNNFTKYVPAELTGEGSAKPLPMSRAWGGMDSLPDSSTSQMGDGESINWESIASDDNNVGDIPLSEAQRLLKQRQIDFIVPDFVKERPLLPEPLKRFEVPGQPLREQDVPEEFKGMYQEWESKSDIWKEQENNYEAMVDAYTTDIARQINRGDSMHHVMEVRREYGSFLNGYGEIIKISRYAEGNGLYDLSSVGMDYIRKNDFIFPFSLKGDWPFVRIDGFRVFNKKDLDNIFSILENKKRYENELRGMSKDPSVDMKQLHDAKASRQKLLDNEIKKASDDKKLRLDEHVRRRILITWIATGIVGVPTVMYGAFRGIMALEGMGAKQGGK